MSISLSSLNGTHILVKSDRCSLRFEYSLFSIHTVLFYLMCSGMLKIKKGS